jgi:ubiquitin C-terminal hydrolase
MLSCLSDEYDLYAIVHHVGRLGDGHYIATVLLQKITSDDSEQDDPADAHFSGKGECMPC